jgi:hypothetical protein
MVKYGAGIILKSLLFVVLFCNTGFCNNVTILKDSKIMGYRIDYANNAVRFIIITPRPKGVVHTRKCRFLKAFCNTGEKLTPFDKKNQKTGHAFLDTKVYIKKDFVPDDTICYPMTFEMPKTKAVGLSLIAGMIETNNLGSIQEVDLGVYPILKRKDAEQRYNDLIKAGESPKAVVSGYGNVVYFALKSNVKIHESLFKEVRVFDSNGKEIECTSRSRGTNYGYIYSRDIILKRPEKSPPLKDIQIKILYSSSKGANRSVVEVKKTPFLQEILISNMKNKDSAIKHKKPRSKNKLPLWKEEIKDLKTDALEFGFSYKTPFVVNGSNKPRIEFSAKAPVDPTDDNYKMIRGWVTECIADSGQNLLKNTGGKGNLYSVMCPSDKRLEGIVYFDQPDVRAKFIKSVKGYCILKNKKTRKEWKIKVSLKDIPIFPAY